MYQTTKELRGAVPYGVAVVQVKMKQAASNKVAAQVYYEECRECAQVGWRTTAPGEFEAFATENGWAIEPGWWWVEDEAEEQMHGPFTSERDCLVHCLTWQHVLVNGAINGHLKFGEVWAPGMKKVVSLVRSDGKPQSKLKCAKCGVASGHEHASADHDFI